MSGKDERKRYTWRAFFQLPSLWSSHRCRWKNCKLKFYSLQQSKFNLSFGILAFVWHSIQHHHFLPSNQHSNLEPTSDIMFIYVSSDSDFDALMKKKCWNQRKYNISCNNLHQMLYLCVGWLTGGLSSMGAHTLRGCGWYSLIRWIQFNTHSSMFFTKTREIFFRMEQLWSRT